MGHRRNPTAPPLSLQFQGERRIKCARIVRVQSAGRRSLCGMRGIAQHSALAETAERHGRSQPVLCGTATAPFIQCLFVTFEQVHAISAAASSNPSLVHALAAAGLHTQTWLQEANGNAQLAALAAAAYGADVNDLAFSDDGTCIFWRESRVQLVRSFTS